MLHRSIHRIAVLLLAIVLLGGIQAARAAPTSVHLTLGNPSSATADVNAPANYLIVRDQYALSYHRDRGIPNWVSWHLAASDLGSVARYDGNFITDTSLPTGWYRVTHADYLNSGYDRGHMTPSADRTVTEVDNQATFLLTNIVPQAPDNNQGLWAQLEEYTRSLVAQGNEVYVVAGGAGTQATLASGKLAVPANVWKVLLVLPAAEGDDLTRITAQTTVLAVWTPNSAVVQGKTWQSYQISVRCVEERSGLDLLSAIDDAVETSLQGASCPASSLLSLYLPLVAAGAAAPPPPEPVPPQVTIVEVAADPPGIDLDGEYVRLRNDGLATVSMTGWTLRDAANTVYTFPAFGLAAGAEVRVWVKAGIDDAANLYWGRGSAVWNNTGDTATLRDASGNEVTRFSYT